MTKVLVTAIGTSTATAIVIELKKNYKDIYVVGADINEDYMIVTSKEVDEFCKFPSSIDNRDKYYKFVIDYCISKEIKFVFSTIDEEVYDFTYKTKMFEKNGIKICAPDFETVKICHMKNIFSEWIKKNIPQILIETFKNTNEITRDDFPLFAKPVEGRASNGCKTLENLEDLKIFEKKCDIRNYILQKKYFGDIITVDIVRDRKNSIINMCQRVETLRNGNGCGIAVEIVDFKELDFICNELAIKLDLNGVINAEFFKTETGYKIIEVNPRFSAGALFSAMAGVNTVCCAFEIANGKKIKRATPSVGKRFAKRYEVYEM